MRILHVLSSARAEGTPKLVLDWLSVKEHEQSVLILNNSGELLDEFKAKTQLYHQNDFVPSFKNARKIADFVSNVCNDFKPDLVIAWPTGHSQWIHWGARKSGIKKKITHIGNPPGKSFFGRYVATALTFWLSYFFKVKFIACSKYVKNCYKNFWFLPKKNIYYAYNAIRLNAFSMAENKSGSVMVATLEKHKDHYTLLEAASKFPQKTGKIDCYGAGSLKAELHQKIHALGIENSVILHGSVNNIPEILSKAKVFVLSTTENEGFGTVLIEALASGCYVVATEVEASKEVLEHGKWGVLVEKNNSEALATAIDEASNRESLSQKELEQRAEFNKQFSVGSMVDAYIRVSNA